MASAMIVAEKVYSKGEGSEDLVTSLVLLGMRVVSWGRNLALECGELVAGC